nr:hypothetical protein [Candidatus Sigynarchaeota archaeon]
MENATILEDSDNLFKLRLGYKDATLIGMNISLEGFFGVILIISLSILRDSAGVVIFLLIFMIPIGIAFVQEMIKATTITVDKTAGLLIVSDERCLNRKRVEIPLDTISMFRIVFPESRKKLTTNLWVCWGERKEIQLYRRSLPKNILKLKELLESRIFGEQFAQSLPASIAEKPVRCAKCGGIMYNKRCTMCKISWCSNCGAWNAPEAERCNSCQFMLPP